MDPFTAVGLAGNIAQLIELSWKVVSKSREIRKHGASPENRHMHIVTDDLGRINCRVMAYLQRDDMSRGADAGDEELWRLCESSNQIATQLIKRLQDCTVSQEHGTWKSFRKALKTEWNKSELDSVAAQLQGYRAQLNTRILVLVREEVSQISQTAENIMDSLAELRAFIGENHGIMKNYLTTLITSQSTKIQHIIGLSLGDSSSGGLMSRSELTAYRAPLSHSTSDPRNGVDDFSASFFEAVKEQDMDRVRDVIRSEPSMILASNSSGQTALHIAAGLGNTDLVDYLIRRGAEINPDDNDGQLPLHHAVKSGSVTTVRSLVARAGDPLARDKQGKSPKDLSSPGSLVHWILVHGSSFQVTNANGQTALGHFASQGNVDACRELVSMGADMEHSGHGNGRTPLLEAVEANQVDVVRLLVSSHANIEARDPRQSTPLVVAAFHGFTEIGKMLLDHGADMDAVNQHRYSPLHEACYHNRTELGLALIQAGADCKTFNEFGHSAWHVCANNGYYTLLRAMLDKNPDMNMDFADKHGWTALEQASEHNHEEVVAFLLERSADPNTRFPLYRAAWHGHTAVVKQLLRHGADPERSAGDDSPLNRASLEGFLEVVVALLASGNIDVNSSNKDGWTPLQQASVYGHVSVIRELLKHGADPNIGDKEGYKPLNRASIQGHVEVVTVLLEHKDTDIHGTNHNKWTSLHEASTHGHTSVVRALLQNGADPTLGEKDGYRALNLASWHGHLAIVMMLLERKDVDVNCLNKDKWAPLHEASCYGYIDIVKALLDHGARTDLQNDQGHTPLALAVNANHADVVMLLASWLAA